MTSENKENRIDIELPDSLKQQMKKFERRLCLVETSVSVFGGIGGAMLTYSILLMSDRFWDTATWLRAPITIAGAFLFGIFVYMWVHRWCLRRRNQSQLAKLIQREYRQLGDRLQGVIELASSENRPENVSPALCRAAVKQLSGEVSKYEFSKAVQTKKARTYFLYFLVLLAVIASAIVFCPDVAWNTLVRWAKPLSDVERYTFLSIKDIPSEKVVPHGEEFIIACMVEDESFWHPTNAFCSAEGQAIIHSLINNKVVTFNIPGQITPVDFVIRIGDAKKKLRIKPVFRPELIRMNALITLPDYLKRPIQTKKVTGGMLKVLEGSTVRLNGYISRDLKEAEMTKPEKKMMTTQSNRFETASMSAGKIDECVFEWTDSLGLSCSKPYTLNSSTTHDIAPLVSCDGIGRSIAMLSEEVVNVKLNAEDDYGLKKLWVAWNSINHKKQKISKITGTKDIEDGNPASIEIAGNYAFSPVIAGIPEGVAIELFAAANDYMPGRKPTESERFYIYVISKAQHEKLIREKVDMLLAQLESITRNEEDLLLKNEKLSKQSPEELNSRKSEHALKESSAEERENAKSLKKLADEGEKLLKEALRNKDVEAALLKEWAEMFKSMKDLSQNEAQQTLQNAAANKQQRMENLKKAIAQEKEIIKALKELSKKLNKSIDDMLAYSIVERLKAAAGNEGKIEKDLKGMVAKSIGVNPEDLPPELFRKMAELAKLQKVTRKDVKYIQDDIAGFYNRTRKERYEDVFQEMNEVKIHKRLKEIEKLIESNHGGQAMTGALAQREQLLKWAEYLAPSKEDGESEGGNCNKQMTQDELEVLITLARARQQEGSLRAQTRALNENKESNDNYLNSALALADMQNDIKKTVDPLVFKVKNPKAQEFIMAVSERMSEAGGMLSKPQTGAETIAVETEIIEMLTGCMNSACSSQSMAMSMALMQAMGIPMPAMSESQTGGGNPAGGTTDKENDPVRGSTDGGDVDGRDVKMSSGASMGDIPEEFREIMEAYYNALEAE